MGLEERVTLNNGVTMPRFGLGVYQSGAYTGEAVAHALAVGYRMIDTAAFYHNESLVGKAVRESGIPRETIFITTKIWNDDQRADNQAAAVKKSLTELDVGYIDLYLIHWPVAGKFTDTWKYLEDFYAAGTVKAIGVSNFLEHHIAELLTTSGTIPAVNQFECHPFLTREELRAFCSTKGIVCEAWSPLGRGDVLQSRTIQEIAKRHRKTAAQIALRWDYQNGIVTIPKSVHRKRISENAAIFDFELTADEMEMISDLDAGKAHHDPDNFSF